jgi:hypothetical protein
MPRGGTDPRVPAAYLSTVHVFAPGGIYGIRVMEGFSSETGFLQSVGTPGFEGQANLGVPQSLTRSIAPTQCEHGGTPSAEIAPRRAPGHRRRTAALTSVRHRSGCTYVA